MEYTFKSGAKVTGTLEQILTIGRTLGEAVKLEGLIGISSIPRGYYLSRSKGLIPIEAMPTSHIRNALLKETSTYIEFLKGLPVETKTERSYLLSKFCKLANQPQIIDLFNELSRR